MTKRDEECPGCEHPMGVHTFELGCTEGWGPYVDGLAQNQGCECPLTLAQQHDPPSEREL